VFTFNSEPSANEIQFSPEAVSTGTAWFAEGSMWRRTATKVWLSLLRSFSALSRSESLDTKWNPFGELVYLLGG